MIEVEGEKPALLSRWDIYSKFKDLNTNGIYPNGMENCVWVCVCVCVCMCEVKNIPIELTVSSLTSLIK